MEQFQNKVNFTRDYLEISFSYIDRGFDGSSGGRRIVWLFTRSSLAKHTGTSFWLQLRMNGLIEFLAKVYCPLISKFDLSTHWVAEILPHKKSTHPTKLHYQWRFLDEGMDSTSIFSQISLTFDFSIWPLTLSFTAKSKSFLSSFNTIRHS